LVEQRIRNAKVTSSIPVTGTIRTKREKGLGFGQALFRLKAQNIGRP
jgi:hypothetical protein